MPLERGTVLNNMYRVVNILGKGGMGNVYLVEREKDDTRFVVKELVITEGLGLDNAREIFFREAEFMAKFNHDGLPRMHGVFTCNGSEYLTMDYIEGETLEEIINKSSGPLSEDKAIRYAIEIAGIIDYLHNSFHAPIVYRDLKPSNIIITPDGKVKLVDFGIARYYNPDKTADTFRFGSPGYAAPEQYKGRGQSGPQADVYGLGVILFQMLTKYDPTVKLFSFPSLTSLNPSVSEELEGIINRAIQLDPLKRYISMDDFKVKLSKYLGVDKKKIFKEPVLSNNIFGKTGKNLGFASIIFFFVFIILNVYYVEQSIIELAAIICGVTYMAAVVSSIAGIILPFLNKDISFAPTMDAIVLNAVILTIFAILLPNFISHRPTGGQCAACQSNIKNLATALEMYSTDYIGLYPPSLDYLTNQYDPNNSNSYYMRTIPICPASYKSAGNTYGYVSASRPDNYTLWCNVRGAHSRAGYPKNECWPQYSSIQGLMLPENKSNW